MSAFIGTIPILGACVASIGIVYCMARQSGLSWKPQCESNHRTSTFVIVCRSCRFAKCYDYKNGIYIRRVQVDKDITPYNINNFIKLKFDGCDEKCWHGYFVFGTIMCNECKSNLKSALKCGLENIHRIDESFMINFTSEVVRYINNSSNTKYDNLQGLPDIDSNRHLKNRWYFQHLR